MKEQVKTPVIVVLVVAFVAVLAFFGSKAFSSGDLDQGQVQYTPGKPPWEETDPNKKGRKRIRTKRGRVAPRVVAASARHRLHRRTLRPECRLRRSTIQALDKLVATGRRH